MFCQKCGKEVKEGTFCDNCGNRLDMPSVICYCSNCGAAVEDGRETCGECGAKIEGIFKLDVGSYSRGRGISSTDNTIKRSRKPKKAIVAVSIAAAVVIAAAAAFYFSGVFKGSISGSPVAANAYHKGAALNILTKSFHSDSAGADSPVVKELEKIVGTPLKLDFVADENYYSTLTGIIGSGKYPHVLLINATNLAFLQAVRTGDFWDITDIFKDSAKYPNLSQANADVNHNISIDGKIYGIYRSRTIGRAGISVRKDWLDKLGMTTPETVEEFSQMLRRFTED
ncbi:MAG: extracellular solute-binding protein, partial [Clostridia bacterium]|nr:extracellular solute-binding protein [Clostridia bacterium]